MRIKIISADTVINSHYSCVDEIRIGNYRKLLSHFEKNRINVPAKMGFRRISRQPVQKPSILSKSGADGNNRQFWWINEYLYKDKYYVCIFDIALAPKTWDNWGSWSKCSTTCGPGRKVRWRHCTSVNCTRGLKKAQIKNCLLKDCEKTILNWLGIKS